MKLLSKGQEIYIITVIAEYSRGGVKKRETEIQAKKGQRRVRLILL
jgi:hypothetical protein